MKKENIFKNTLICLFIFMLSYFYITIIKLNVLPAKYFVPVILLSLIISLPTLYFLIKKDKALPKILTIVLITAIALTAPKLSQLESTLDDITDMNKETYTIHVITHIDSPHTTMNDVLNLVFGANTSQDEASIEIAKDQIEDGFKQKIHVKRYENYETLLEDFYQNNPEVFLISESHLEFLSEMKDTFMEDMKIIASYSYSVDLEAADKTDVTSETFSIFITGIDTDGAIDSVSRSDANIILTVNPLQNQILITSIPRDTYVIRHTNGKYDKLSLVGLSGITETLKTIEDFMGMDIEYTLRVNWTSVVKVVDALGGIEVDSPHAFKQGQYYFNKGLNKLDGERALAFVRNRKSLPDDEDSRAQNQQIVLTAIIKKLMSPAIIYNYSDFLYSISNSVQTNLSQNQLNQLIRYQLDHMPSWDIHTTQIIGEMFDTWEAHSAMGRWQIVKEPHQDKLENAINAINKMKQNETITKEMFE